MNVGSIQIKKHAALAPMAGIADRAFREICLEYGAAYVIGEMCSAKGLTYGSENSAELLQLGEQEKPAAVQLFGDEPEVVAKAVVLAKKYKPQIIDINMGCPAPKITRGNSGAALMKNLPLAEEIIKYAVSAAGDIPVTVKFRKGWSDDSINAVDLALIAQKAGAASITIHGRTKEQMYRLPIDLDIIKRVKDAVSIPVIGNGGITTPEQAEKMYEYTGCDLVMVGEGALGKPWIFAQIAEYLDGGEVPPEPTLEEKMETFRRQIKKAVAYKGERIALKESRTHAGWYLKGIPGAATLRREVNQLSHMEDLEIFIKNVLDNSVK